MLVFVCPVYEQNSEYEIHHLDSVSICLCRRFRPGRGGLWVYALKLGLTVTDRPMNGSD